MKHIEDYSIHDDLPESLKRQNAQEIAKTVDEALHRYESKIHRVLIYPVIDQLDSDLVDALAVQLHCDFYDKSLSLEARRQIVKTSIAWHRIKGTPAAVEMLTQTIFKNSFVKEWFDYSGRPYFFRMVQDISDGKEDVTPETLAQLKKAIWMGKNVRSWLEMLEFHYNIRENVEYSEELSTLAIRYSFEDWMPFGNRLWVPERDGSLYRGGVAYRDGEFCRDGSLYRDGIFPGEWPFHHGWDELSMDELFLTARLAFFDDVSAGGLFRDGSIIRNGEHIHGGEDTLPADFGFAFSMRQRLRDIIAMPKSTIGGRLDFRLADIVPYGHRYITQHDGEAERGGIAYRDGVFCRDGRLYRDSIIPGATWERNGADALDMDELFAAAYLSFRDDVSESDIRRDGGIERDGKYLHGRNVFPADFGFGFSLRQQVREEIPATDDGAFSGKAMLALSDIIPYGTNPLIDHSGKAERGGVGCMDGSFERDGSYSRDGPLLDAESERGGASDLKHDHLTIAVHTSITEDVSKEYLARDGREIREGIILHGANPLPRDAGMAVSLEADMEDDAEATDAGGGLSILYSIHRRGEFRRDGTIERGGYAYDDDLDGGLSLLVMDRSGEYCRDGDIERAADGRLVAV